MASSAEMGRFEIITDFLITCLFRLEYLPHGILLGLFPNNSQKISSTDFDGDSELTDFCS